MKVIGIVCSPRIDGNTEILVQEALNSAQGFGADIELVRLAKLKITPCDGCFSCRKTGECHIKDDMQRIYDKLLEADGIILGSPVYFWNVSAQAKILIDRSTRFAKDHALRNKVGGIVVVTGRAGATTAFSTIATYFNLSRMTCAGGAIGHGGDRGEVRKDERGMAEAKALGRVMARLMKRAVNIRPDDAIEQPLTMPPRVEITELDIPS